MAARHRARKRRSIILVAAVPLAAVAIGAGAVALAPTPEPTPCATTIRVVTATSFVPVLRTLAPSLETNDDCARLEINVVDGRAAAGQVAKLDAHVWIPDDTAWAGVADSLDLAEESAAGSGTVVATSPIYMVADKRTAARVAEAGAAGGLLRIS
jgi:Bacterial extracellular solute-binding protein